MVSFFPVIFSNWLFLPFGHDIDCVSSCHGYTPVILDLVHFNSACRFSTSHLIHHLEPPYVVICWTHFTPILATITITSDSFFLMRSNNQVVNVNGPIAFNLKVVSASAYSTSCISWTFPSPAQWSKQEKSEYFSCISCTQCWILSPDVRSRLICGISRAGLCLPKAITSYPFSVKSFASSRPSPLLAQVSKILFMNDDVISKNIRYCVPPLRKVESYGIPGTGRGGCPALRDKLHRRRIFFNKISHHFVVPPL